jgi:hypothetical protein
VTARCCPFLPFPKHHREDPCCLLLPRIGLLHFRGAENSVNSNRTLEDVTLKGGATGSSSDVRLLLFGDDETCDFFVSGLRNNFFGDQVGLLGVRAAVDDFLGVGVANAG